MQRRHFLSSLLSLAVAGESVAWPSIGMANAKGSWRMPAEEHNHERTWMAFGVSEAIWGKKLVPEVRRNLALLANTIAKYEPVSLLVREEEKALAQSLVGEQVTLVSSPLDDLWMRDTGSLFVLNEAGEKSAVDFNFNGWGNKQTHHQDNKVASFITQQAKVPVINTNLVMEGGCIEVDGQGTAILTESCTLNKNRNPKMSKAQFEDILMPLLGLEKIIWLPGIKGQDITDGHTDFYARFAKPGVVLAGYDPDPKSFDHEITLAHLEILKSASDAQGNKLEVHKLEGPVDIRKKFLNKEFAAGYIGYYACNGAIIMQEFGDKQADDNAKAIIQKAFPDRKIEQLNVDGIAAGGGTIHCATQQEPKVKG